MCVHDRRSEAADRQAASVTRRSASLDELVALIESTLQCDQVLLYELVRHGPIVRFAEVVAVGAAPFVRASERIEGLSVFDYLGRPAEPATDLWLGDFWPADDFTLVPASRFEGRQAQAMHWRPGGIASALGTTVTRGEVVLGGVWGVQRVGQPAFSRARLRMARRRLPDIQALFRAVVDERRAASRAPGALSLLTFDIGSHTIAAAPDAAPWFVAPSTRDRLALHITRLAEGDTCCTTRFVRRAPVHFRRLEGQHRMVVALTIEGGSYRTGARELLTYTQRQVADLAVIGATVKEIARALDRQPSTVNHHLKGIYQRLGIGSRSELAYAIQKPATESLADVG